MIQKDKRKLLIICFLFLSLIGWQLYQDKKVEICVPISKGPELVFTIPLKDKKHLEYLFRDIIGWNEGAYSLFGSKPMSVFWCKKPFDKIDWHCFFGSIFLSKIRLYLSLKIWKKYQHLFENGKFLLYVNENSLKQDPNSSFFETFLINKEKFKETIISNIQDFKNVLKREILSGEEFLLEIKNKQFLEIFLKDHNGLIGTLLGYGRDNAWMFEERDNGKIIPLKPLWNEESEEMNFLNNRPYFMWNWFGVCSNNLAEYLGYPTFMADLNSEETQNLKKEFHKTRQKILEYYKDKDFLETTLAILIEGIPN